MSGLRGVVSVLCTPFTAEDRVDARSLRRLVHDAVQAGASGVLALGVNGEAAHLGDDERALVVEEVLVAVDGRVPVVVGCSAPTAEGVAARTASAAAWGATAAMVAVPPEGGRRLEQHVRAAADGAPGLDLVLQDYPASGHAAVGVDELVATAVAVPSIVAVKAEDPPTAVKVADLHAALPELDQLGGLGATNLLWELRAGARGAMTGFAYPDRLVAIVSAAACGDWDACERAYEAALPALVWEAQPVAGLALRKALLHERGLLATPALRAPTAPYPAAAAQARRIAARMNHQEVTA